MDLGVERKAIHTTIHQKMILKARGSKWPGCQEVLYGGSGDGGRGVGTAVAVAKEMEKYHAGVIFYITMVNSFHKLSSTRKLSERKIKI